MSQPKQDERTDMEYYVSFHQLAAIWEHNSIPTSFIVGSEKFKHLGGLYFSSSKYSLFFFSRYGIIIIRSLGEDFVYYIPMREAGKGQIPRVVIEVFLKAIRNDQKLGILSDAIWATAHYLADKCDPDFTTMLHFLHNSPHQGFYKTVMAGMKRYRRLPYGV